MGTCERSGFTVIPGEPCHCECGGAGCPDKCIGPVCDDYKESPDENPLVDR